MSTRTWSPAQGTGGKWVTNVTVVDQEIYDGGPIYFGESWTDGSLDAVIASFVNVRDSIPEEYRASARCEIDSTSGYEGAHYARVKINYNRPSTPEEIAEHERQAAAAARAVEERERAQLGTLMAKYKRS